MLHVKKVNRSVKKTFSISWWKLIAGGALLSIGLIAGIFYFADPHNMFAGVVTVFAIAPGAFLVYMGLKQGDSGFTFNTNLRYTGEENALILVAQHDADTKKDIPLMLAFRKLNHPPKGARLHYIRNLKKHFYELFYNTQTKKLEPVVLPDKKSFPPELYKIPATMQPYKDYMDYSPPSMLQKVAPGILLIAMGIVGLLMVITGG